MKENAPVVIVGGGVIGCATAYYLAQAGVRSVIVEADAIASGASGAAAGILTPYSGSRDPRLLALSPAALQLHAELAEALPDELGLDYGYELRPHLRCAITEQGVTDLRAWQAARKSEGNKTEWLTPSEAKSMTGWLTGEILGALCSEIEPTVEAAIFTMALMTSAERRGARVVSGRVAGLIERPERTATGVVLEDGNEIEADTVVLAMGPWAAHANDWLGWDVPVTPQKGQMLHLAVDERFGKPEVGIANFEQGGVVLPKKLAHTIVGSTREDVGFDRAPTEKARLDMIARAASISENAANSRLAAHTACLRPMPADGMPYVGAVPAWQNMYIATGHWSEGIHYGPLTGKWLADTITGKKSEFDLSALDPARVTS